MEWDKTSDLSGEEEDDVIEQEVEDELEDGEKLSFDGLCIPYLHSCYRKSKNFDDVYGSCDDSDEDDDDYGRRGGGRSGGSVAVLIHRSWDSNHIVFKDNFPPSFWAQKVKANLSNSYYEAKKIIQELGLSYNKIDACTNDCMLYWNEDSLLDSCKVCDHKIYGLKSHDCHVLLQHLLPLALRGVKEPRELEVDELKNCDEVAQLHKGDDSRIIEDLLSLSRDPTKYSTHSNGYVVNGYRFHVQDYDKKLRTQNCGIVVLGENDEDSENVDNYGVLTNVIELFLKTNELFVLVDQASQVFYADDNSNKGWQVVRKTQPRDSYEIVEQMDDDIVGIRMMHKNFMAFEVQDETIKD
ncbi:hypothetical protein KY289_016842 [Solanum tuberosum]|nr:hypothetical protein KY289_016842 [Solanum tuberosum]